MRLKIRSKDLFIELNKPYAGYISIYWNNANENPPYYALHFLVKKSFWLWGKDEFCYDGPIISYGFGPLFLFSKMW